MNSPFAFLVPLLLLVHSLFPFEATFAADPLAGDEKTLRLFFHPSEKPSHLLLVGKKRQKLTLFEVQKTLRPLREFACATGENIGNKRSSGDSRTPEGVYFITEVYEDKKITVFGSRAFHLDYPNVFDSHAGRQGDGIFIHGTNKKLTPNSTNGCITLDNRDLDALAPYLTVGSVPVIVLDATSDATLADAVPLRKDDGVTQLLLEKLSLNAEAIAGEAIDSLFAVQLGDHLVVSLGFYIFPDRSTRYSERRRAYLSRTAGGWWRSLHSVFSQNSGPTLLAQKPLKNDNVVKIRDIAIVEAAMAAQLLTPGGGGSTIDASAATPGNIPPVTATAPPAAARTAAAPADDSRISVAGAKGREGDKAKEKAAKAARPPADDRVDEVLAFVEKWRSSWAAKDLETYMACYSPSFTSDNLDKAGWRARKAFLNDKYKFIKVKLSELKVVPSSTGATVSFHQTYRSDQLQTSGRKTLQLVNRKNRWFIEREAM